MQIRKRAIAHVLLLAALLFITATATPAQGDRTRRVRFARGRTTTVIKDAVVRGTRDRYVLRASAGQTLIAHITSLENNAVFDIYARGGKRILDGAQETTDWTGELPRSGDYVIEVGGTRGNASYTLEVTIR
ncbi:MAG TPA: hypothetical protein VE842_13285 [Pyrinomonadaceae bacterium]|jgi:hypothetical protein|nr:hypothetical protein [Pyrinomonadaceae bacterium]